MSIERNLIITILKLTKSGSVSYKLINKDARIPAVVSTELLKKLQNDRLVYVKNDFVEADSLCRLRLAVRAITLGADIERISGFLQWQEFESMAAVALEENGYRVEKNLRFKHAGRKWEIDIVGCKKPIAICIDCKHWHHGVYPSALRRITEAQVERTRTLADFLPSLSGKIECDSWDTVELFPAVLSLMTGSFKFYDNVPVVSVLQLQDFLHQLPAYMDSLKHFSRQLSHLSDNF